MDRNAGKNLISIIIPTYNRAEMLSRALKSVLLQKHVEWECIVVDDGSTDQTSVIMQSFLEDPRFSYIATSHAGVSAARNKGLQLAKGQYIAFLDSDDVWMPHKLEKQLIYMQAGSWKIVQTHEIWIRDGVRVNPPKHCEKFEGDLFKASLERCMITPSSVMIHRTLFEEYGTFDERLPACEDYDFWLRICAFELVGLVDMVGLTRFGGHADQLSSSVPQLDRYRICALFKILGVDQSLPPKTPIATQNRSQSQISMEKMAQAWAILDKKTQHYTKGCQKHGRLEDVDYIQECLLKLRNTPNFEALEQ
jgi:glycosyltransferase involved in cell wall biosynthesis